MRSWLRRSGFGPLKPEAVAQAAAFDAQCEYLQPSLARTIATANHNGSERMSISELYERLHFSPPPVRSSGSGSHRATESPSLHSLAQRCRRARERATRENTIPIDNDTGCELSTGRRLAPHDEQPSIPISHVRPRCLTVTRPRTSSYEYHFLYITRTFALHGNKKKMSRKPIDSDLTVQP
ncbi:hypothetical protein BC826DRAFT_1004573 [Russula brevipes]|nr:hypothetical protein BC826DRAFT_1004573 [Russula brevipes]